jgi:hypothetical protein
VVDKRIHWEAVPQFKLQHTIWGATNGGGAGAGAGAGGVADATGGSALGSSPTAAAIDVTAFQELFCRAPASPPKTGRGGGAARPGGATGAAPTTAATAAVALSFLPTQRANNITICLQRFLKVYASLAEIHDALTEMDDALQLDDLVLLKVRGMCGEWRRRWAKLTPPMGF